MSGSEIEQFSKLSGDVKLDKLWEKLCKVDEQSSEMNKNISSLKDDLNRIDVRVEKCENSHKNLQDEVNLLKVTVNDLQQSALNSDVIIRNVDEIEKNDEDLLTVTQLILQKITIPITVNIVNVRRLGRKLDGKAKCRPILLTLCSSMEKDHVLTAKKKVLLKASDVIFENTAIGGNNSVIYFDEHITKQTADLFFAARQLRKRQMLKYVWIRGGKLYVKKREGDQPTRVTHLAKLEELAKRKYNSTPNNSGDNTIGLQDSSMDTYNATTIIPNETKKLRPDGKNDVNWGGGN